MRILYITNAFPFPLTSGYLRHYHLIRELSRYHEVHLLSVVGTGHQPEHRSELEKIGARCEVFFSGGRAVSRASKVLPGVALGGLRQLGRVAQRRVAQGLVDITVISGKQTAAVLGNLAGRPVLADLCDATSSRLLGEARERRGLRRVELLTEWAGVKLLEHRLIRLSDHTTVASERDRRMLGLVEARCSVVPNGIDATYWQREANDLGRDTVVFTGKLDYPPNEDAALCLVNDVLPELRRRVPTVSMVIVGLRPTRRLTDAAARQGAVLTGEVPDVRPYLDRASVFAAPLRFGAGIQNKVLEAMAMDVPVVCSDSAAAGLRVGGESPPVEIAEDPVELIDALERRLGAARHQPKPSKRGSAYIARHFRWDLSAATMIEILERLVQDRTCQEPAALSMRIDR